MSAPSPTVSMTEQMLRRRPVVGASVALLFVSWKAASILRRPGNGRGSSAGFGTGGRSSAEAAAGTEAGLLVTRNIVSSRYSLS